VAEAYTFYFAPEIELSVVSECWHAPDRLSVVKRELDPAVHLTQPHLRWILEALDLAYRELGAVNFEIVVQVLREMHHLEDCGGLEGLNEVYKAAAYGRDPVRDQKIFDAELAMLKQYAINRKVDPPHPPDFFTRGQLVLYPNKTKHFDSQPDATGEGKIGGRCYRATAWLESDQHGQEFFKVSLTPK
jgi:hypothetical protein